MLLAIRIRNMRPFQSVGLLNILVLMNIIHKSYEMHLPLSCKIGYSVKAVTPMITQSLCRVVPSKDGRTMLRKPGLT